MSEIDLVEKIEKKLNQIFVNKTSQIYRPESIECFVNRFNVKGELWVAVVGLLYDRPIEIFTGHSDDLWMPSWVEKGWILKTMPDGLHERYDFQFEDRQGYKVTLEGISRIFIKSAVQANKMITKLLMSDTKIDLILDAIRDFPFDEIPNVEDYYLGISDALSDFHDQNT